MSDNSCNAAQANREWYDRLTAGQEDYWRLMAAPRLRVRTALKAVARANPARLCDFGCGNGALLEAVHARFPGTELMGLDLSPELVAHNQTRLPHMAFACADLCDPAFALPWEPVHMALSLEVLEHLQEPAAYLKSIRKSLAPGGGLFLSTQSGRIRETERRVGHIRHWSAQDMAQALTDAGFTAVTVRNAGWPFHDLSKHLANRNPDKTMQSFGESAYGPKQRFVCWGLRVLFAFNSGSRGSQLFATAQA